MPQTCLSNAATLLPVSEFLKRCDQRTVGQLCSDDNSDLGSSDLQTNANLAACLADASGELESAATMGQRYMPTDLAALSGVARAKMYRILTDLTMAYLYERRPHLLKTEPPQIARAMLWLEQLAQGTRIFAFQETMAATIPSATVMTPSEVEQRNNVTFQAARMFGRLADRESQGA